MPVAETQAGKGALVWDHPSNVGAIGVTGGSAGNSLAAEADVVLAIGTRLSDFTTASRRLFRHSSMRLIQLNVAGYDSGKHGALPVADAAALRRSTRRWPAGARRRLDREGRPRRRVASGRRSDGGTVGRPATDRCGCWARSNHARRRDIVVCAAGGLPGAAGNGGAASPAPTTRIRLLLHGVEIASGLGAKPPRPNARWVMVGDGSI